MKKLFVRFDCRDGSIITDDNNLIEVENEGSRTVICGQIYDMTANEAANCVGKLGAGATEKLNGQYIIYHYDKKNKELTVIHDRSTSPLNLYYTSNNSFVYISTSLKKLLSESNIERRLNRLAAEEFLINNFTNNKTTLIENVFKLEAFRALKVTKNGVGTLEVKYPVEDISVERAKDQWRPTLDGAIAKRFLNEDEINGTLSSGFDSNYILWSAKQQSDKHARMFSVGGAKGKNEVPIVEENVKNYDNVELITELTDSDTMENFPDIAWRLEGGVYETGIFLQYVLNRMLKKNGVKYMLCGEVADQVMNPGYWDESIIYPADAEEGNITHYEFAAYPFMYGHFVILKKNGILSNTFDVECRYPFLDNDFLPSAKALIGINGRTKEYHKEVCRKLLPEGIVKNMTKIGGTTDVRSLFRDKKHIKDFIKFVESSETFAEFRKYFELDPGLLPETAKEKLDYRKNKILSELFGYKKEKITEHENLVEEMLLRKYILCMNLQLFRDLFISGKYDGSFDKDGINVKLTDYMHQ